MKVDSSPVQRSCCNVFNFVAPGWLASFDCSHQRTAAPTLSFLEPDRLIGKVFHNLNTLFALLFKLLFEGRDVRTALVVFPESLKGVSQILSGHVG